MPEIKKKDEEDWNYILKGCQANAKSIADLNGIDLDSEYFKRILHIVGSRESDKQLRDLAWTAIKQPTDANKTALTDHKGYKNIDLGDNTLDVQA